MKSPIMDGVMLNRLALCVRRALAFVGIKNKKNHGVLPERQGIKYYNQLGEEVTDTKLIKMAIKKGLVIG